MISWRVFSSIVIVLMLVVGLTFVLALPGGADPPQDPGVCAKNPEHKHCSGGETTTTVVETTTTAASTTSMETTTTSAPTTTSMSTTTTAAPTTTTTPTTTTVAPTTTMAPTTTTMAPTTTTSVPTTTTTVGSTTTTTFVPSPQEPGGTARPGWIVSCQYSHMNNDDPIVFPGQEAVAHTHEYAGATTTNNASTPQSLRAGGTTCAVEADHAAYWVPALFKNGVLLHPQGTSRNALFYYRRVGISDSGTVQTIPDGLKMIIGNAHATSPSENPQLGSDIIFKCGPGSTTDLPAPPSQCSSGIMVLSLRFPNCWDGVNLDSPDHRSHMAYPSGGRCPASHPVNIPRVESFFRYNVGTGPIGTITFSSGPYYTLHQDFFNAWRPEQLKALVDNCMNALIDCGTNPTP